MNKEVEIKDEGTYFYKLWYSGLVVEYLSFEAKIKDRELEVTLNQNHQIIPFKISSKNYNYNYYWINSAWHLCLQRGAVTYFITRVKTIMATIPIVNLTSK